MIRARDAMDIITMLSGVLFGEDTEYDLVGINIIQDIRTED